MAAWPETTERQPFAFRFPDGFRPLREGLSVCAVMLVAVIGYLRLWQAHWRVPWAYSGDGTANLEAVQSIMQSGWNLHTARVGAPFSGSTVDFPSGGESIHWLSLKLLGYVLRSPSLTANTYYLLSFFLIALTTYYVARYLGLSRAPSLLVAVLYGFLPYHELRGQIDLARAAYYWVPLVLLVMLWLVSWRTQLYRVSPGGALQVRRGRVAFVAVVCVVQGVSDTQVSIFAICILVGLGVFLAVGYRDGRPLCWALGIAGLIGVTLLVANTPYVVARLTRGPNLAAAHRTLVDQEVYGLRVVLMLLPVEGHRIGALAHLTARARISNATETGEALGLLGAIGFLAGLITFFSAGVLAPRSRSPLRGALTILGAISIAAVLLASVDGLAFLIALAGMSLLRVWDRIVVVIGLLSYLSLGLLVERGLSRVGSRLSPRPLRFGVKPSRALSAAVVLGLVLVGVADQTPPSSVPDYRAIAARYDVDASFFGQLEAQVPKGSMIFQYPLMVYPENGPAAELADYGEFVGYLHTTTLKWSYGAIKGRPQGDWQQSTLANLPAATATAALAAIGFRGVWVDREGYVDHGAAFEAQLRPLLGAPALVSSDQRMAYYDLGAARARLTAGMTADQSRAFAAAVLTAVDQTYGTGFNGPDSTGPPMARWAAQRAQLTLTNVTGRTQDVELTGVVSGNGPGQVAVHGPGASATVPLSATAPNPLRVPLRLPPGASTISFEAAAPGPAPSAAPWWFSLSAVQVAPPALHAALCQFEQGPTRPLDCG